jgi:thymidylate synthase
VPQWPTCGRAWLALLRHVLADPGLAPDDRGPVLEGPPALFGIGSFSRTDPILVRYGHPARMDLYDRKFTEDEICPPFKYSYGARLRGFRGTDQLAWAASLLAERPYSKSGWVSLTGPGEDPAAVPCLSAMAFRARGGTLQASAIFRSQNALTAYLNYLPLRDVQSGMAQRLGLPCGPLRVYVDMPHVYVADVPEIRRILRVASHRTRCERKRRVSGSAG